LPEVPSAKEMEQNGINVSGMNMILLKKGGRVDDALNSAKRRDKSIAFRN
jgi:hypothetical protein